MIFSHNGASLLCGESVSLTWVELPEVAEVPVQTRIVAAENKQLSVVGN